MPDSRTVGQIDGNYSRDHGDFGSLTDPYRRELLVHCYRILGSLDDAEDALQDALLSAWRQFDSLRSPTSLRAWLYRIATNTSLNRLASRKARSMRVSPSGPADPRDALPAPTPESDWLDLLPDEYLAGDLASPEARYESKESVTLAFLAALQLLPGRQRAVLIMSDVLGWKSSEIATLLEQSVAAVNSALQRARATMKRCYDQDGARMTADDAQIAALLSRYVQAWEAGDAAGLVALLREDAVLTMPPLPAWYRGRAAIREFLDLHVFTSPTPGRQFRVTVTRANGCPALASYQLDEAGVYRPGAMLVLTFAGDQIAQVDDFLALDQPLFLRFNLPLSL